MKRLLLIVLPLLLITGCSQKSVDELNPVNVISIEYDLESMTITWEESNDNDFVSYELLESDSETGTYSSVAIITDQSITSYSLAEYDPYQGGNWFKVKITDSWGLNSTGTGMVTKPIIVDITIIFNDFLDSLGIDVNIDWVHEYLETDNYGNELEPYYPNHPYSNADTSFYIYPGTTVIENVYTGNNVTG